MIDWYQILTLAAFIGMLVTAAIELVNLRFLWMLWNWSQDAGKNLISQVVSALNLRKGEIPLKDDIQNLIKSDNLQEALGKISESNPEIAKEVMGGIDWPGIVGAIVTGQMKPGDLKPYAPLILKQLMASQNGESQSGGGSHSGW